MPTALEAAVSDLPATVARILTEFIEEARSALGPTLRAIALFGSAAENRLRATSDVNVVVVTRFDRAASRRSGRSWSGGTRPSASRSLAGRRPSCRRGRSLRGEVRRHGAPAPDAHGLDPFVGLTASRAATIARLRQVLLNQVLRLRASYAVDGEREERLAMRVAEAAGPLRVSAAEILELDGGPALAPRDALAHIAEGWTWPDRAAVLAAISEARETRHLAPGRAGETFLGVIDLAGYLHRRASLLS